MIVSREEILNWMKEHNETILGYANAHNMQPQEVINMLNGRTNGNN